MRSARLWDGTRAFYVALALTAVFTTTFARGGEATAVVTGFVTSNGAPLAHMRVASDEIETVTDERGEYRLLVTPGRRFVRVGTSKRVFDIGAGETARFDFGMQVSSELDAIPRKTDDPEHAMVDLRLSADEMAFLPLGRTLSSIAELLPAALQPGSTVFVDGVPLPLYAVQSPIDFQGSVNILTIARPVEFGHAIGGVLLATTPVRSGTHASVFAYWQPKTSTTNLFGTQRSRHWDAGFTLIRPLTERLWLFAGYGRLTDDTEFLGPGTQRFRSSTNALIAKLDLTATPSVKVIAEGFGDPGKTTFDSSDFTPGVFHTGSASGSLRAFGAGSRWVSEGGVSHSSLTNLSFFSPHVTRAHADVQRLLGAHVLRFGAESSRTSGQLRPTGIVMPFHLSETNSAFYAADTWHPSDNLVINAGVRHEESWLPRTAVIWQAAPKLRLFTTWGRYADDPPFGSTNLPLEMSEASAGVELSHYLVTGSARLLRRTIEGQTLNGVLLEAHQRVAFGRFNVFYLFSDREHRHQLTASCGVPFGRFDFGTIIRWSSGDFRTDIHLGVPIDKVSLVADVMNVVNGDARAVRFGIRGAL